MNAELRRKLEALRDKHEALRVFCDVRAVRVPSQDDLREFDALRESVPSYVDAEIKPILTVEGWLATEMRARSDGIILLAAGWDLEDFLRSPAFRMLHSIPIGVWTQIEKRATGLYGRAAMFDTAAGRDARTLAQAGALRFFSAAFDIDFDKFDWDNGISHRHSLIEGSLVDTPGDMDSTVESVARAHNLKLETVRTQAPAISKGSQMELKDVKDEITRSMSPLEATVQDVKSQVNKLDKTVTEAREAAESGKRTAAETRELFDKVSADVQRAQESLDKAIKEVKERKTLTQSQTFLSPATVREMFLNYEPREIRASCTRDDAEKIIALQRANDDLVLIDAMMYCSSVNSNGQYARKGFVERIKGLKTFSRFNELRRAMDTDTASEGLEWVNVAMSGSLMEDVRLNLVVAGLFDEIAMPTQAFPVPTQGAATIAKLIGEKTTVVSGFDSNEETPPTGKFTLDAIKLRARYQISVEMTEDAAFALLPFVRGELVFSISRAIERACVEGDDSTTHFDTGYTVAATDARRAWKGLRYYANSLGDTINVDGATYSLKTIRAGRAPMGKYGAYPSQLAFITSIGGYLYGLLDPERIPQFTTLDKMGPAATVLTGQIGSVDAAPAVISEFMADNLDGDGIYSGAGLTLTSQLWVNRRMWKRGSRRAIELLSERDIINDVLQIVAFWRGDFKPVFTPSASYVTVNQIYNITTTA